MMTILGGIHHFLGPLWGSIIFTAVLKQRQTSSTAFVDAVGSVSSGDLFFPRQLTIGDLKDYAKRTYHGLQKTDLIATVSDQPGTTK